ncbi:MAG: lytic transglycosylase domain-containing protein [Methylococcaceae bacterium]|nr:lytic transglycosylase domain-containing protein [Methylococcaceae bacterium]
MPRSIASLILVLLPVLMAKEARADVYKYVDGSGHVFYTDKPKHSGYALILRSPPPSFSFVRASTPRSRSSGSGFKRYGELSAARAQRREELTPLIEAAANRYSLDPALLHAVIRAESAYNPEAVSNKGAAGLMQLMPATASRFGVRDRFDPEDNIEGGARYLSQLIDMFESDIKLAVAAYNSGENTVKKFGNQVPPIAETQNYVDRVLSYYNR